MRYVAWTRAISVVLLASSTALAQGNGSPAAPEASTTSTATSPTVPASTTSPVAAPASSTPPVSATSPVQAPPSAGSCVLGVHGGIEEPDADTTLRLVCAEFRRLAPSSASSYVVEIGRLGSAVILTVSEQDASGRVIDRSQLRLANIEEVPTAAPRLAEALVHHTAVQSTQRVDNLVEQDARKYRKKSGETHFGLGVAGAAYPGATSVVSPGIQLSLYHETGNFGFGGDLIGVVSPDSQSKTASFAALSIGGRYFTSSSDVSPYFGGGLSYASLKVSDSDFDGSNTGVAAYLEGGVEAFRTNRSHLLFGVRANVPFYSAVDQGGYHYSSYDSASSAEPREEKSKYVVPVTFNATVLF